MRLFGSRVALPRPFLGAVQVSVTNERELNALSIASRSRPGAALRFGGLTVAVLEGCTFRGNTALLSGMTSLIISGFCQPDVTIRPEYSSATHEHKQTHTRALTHTHTHTHTKGGAIHSTSSWVTITASTFAGNDAGTDGGALAFTGATGATGVALVDVVIANNTATTAGGGVHVTGAAWFTAANITVTGNALNSASMQGMCESALLLWSGIGLLLIHTLSGWVCSSTSGGGCFFSGTENVTVADSYFASNFARGRLALFVCIQ